MDDETYESKFSNPSAATVHASQDGMTKRAKPRGGGLIFLWSLMPKSSTDEFMKLICFVVHFFVNPFYSLDNAAISM